MLNILLLGIYYLLLHLDIPHVLQSNRIGRRRQLLLLTVTVVIGSYISERLVEEYERRRG